jgi:hypothetical protein
MPWLGHAGFSWLIWDDREAADRLADRWARGQPAAVKKVENLLASANMDAVWAETLVLEFDAFEHIERLEATAEQRRNAVLHEIERRRAGRGTSLHRVVAHVEDAIYEDLTPKPKRAGEPP